MTTSPLDELEAVARSVPEYLTKNDPRPEHDAMLAWLLGLDQATRSAVLQALPMWLREDGWKAVAAMEIAVGLGEPGLMTEAVREAGRRGVHDDPEIQAPVAPWLSYHLELSSAL